MLKQAKFEPLQAFAYSCLFFERRLLLLPHEMGRRWIEVKALADVLRLLEDEKLYHPSKRLLMAIENEHQNEFESVPQC